MMKSINDRVGDPSGVVNPCLYWVTGSAYDTIRVGSMLTVENDGTLSVLDYSDPLAIWGDDCTPDPLNQPLSDSEFASLLRNCDIV